MLPLLQRGIDPERIRIPGTGRACGAPQAVPDQDKGGTGESPEQLELEIREIDNQHRELIAILQQTNDLLHTSAGRQMLFAPSIIQKIYYYSRYHFSFEEEHMAMNGYPQLKSHRELHKAFIQKVSEFIDAYNRNEATLTGEIVDFLKDWTISHILNEDKKYKSFFMKNAGE